MDKILEYFGWAIIGITILMGIIALWLAIKKWLHLYHSNNEGKTVIDKIDALQKSDLKKDLNAESTNFNARFPSTRLVYHEFVRGCFRSITQERQNINQLRKEIEFQGGLAVSEMEKSLNTLTTIAGAAPMIGFLGTVVGMMMTMSTIKGGNWDPAEIAEGIFTAMNTTLAGLVVGILAYISYNALVGKVSKMTHTLERVGDKILDKCQAIQNENISKSE